MKKLDLLTFNSLIICFFAFLVLFLTVEASAEHFFQQHSTWYEKIPDNPSIYPNSYEYVSDLIINSDRIGTEYSDWSIPIFYAESGSPVKFVACSSTPPSSQCQYQIDKGWRNVPIPPEAVPAGNDATLAGNTHDGHIIIISADRRYLWEMNYAVKYKDGSWKALNCRKWDLYTSDGINSPYDNHGKTRISGAPLPHGLITFKEIQSGVIDHALAFGYDSTKYNAHWGVYPCETYVQGTSSRTWAMVEGMRLQLDPSVNCYSLGLNRYGEIVCKALQEYGMILAINTSSGYNNLYAESSEYNLESWKGIIGSLSAIPLKKFRVVKPIYPSKDTLKPSPPFLNEIK